MEKIPLYTVLKQITWPKEEINAMGIIEADPDKREYKGKICCIQEGDKEKQHLEFKWIAKVTNKGYDINPLNRKGIKSESSLAENQFTHSKYFDIKIRDYIQDGLEKFLIIKDRN